MNARRERSLPNTDGSRKLSYFMPNFFGRHRLITAVAVPQLEVMQYHSFMETFSPFPAPFTSYLGTIISSLPPRQWPSESQWSVTRLHEPQHDNHMMILFKKEEENMRSKVFSLSKITAFPQYRHQQHW
jgi:hypothetical protein